MSDFTIVISEWWQGYLWGVLTPFVVCLVVVVLYTILSPVGDSYDDE